MRSPAGTRALAWLTILGGVVSVSACARNAQEASPRKLNQTYSPRVVTEGQPVPRGGGSFKIGSPYQIKGLWFTPKEEPGYDRQGIASWYGADFHGRKTANGEVYDMNALTAAHPTLPIPSYANVTNLDTGRTLLVGINDRGPYAHDRIIDMSRQSAKLLGFFERGTTRVRVTLVGPAPLDGNERRELQYLASQPWYRQGYARNGSQNDTTVYKQPYMAAPTAVPVPSNPIREAATPKAGISTSPGSHRAMERPWGLGAGTSTDRP